MLAKKKILIHLPFTIKPVNTGARRRILGTLQYFQDRKDFFAVDAVSRNEFGNPQWDSEQEQEILKLVDNFFVYDGEHNLLDFLYSRSQSFYYQKLWRQQLPVDSDYSTPPGYINFVNNLIYKKTYDFIWINFLDQAHLALNLKSSAIHTVIDMHDIACEIRMAIKNIPYIQGLKFDYESNFIREVKLLNKFETVITNSQQEMSMLKSHIPSEKLYLVPHLVEDSTEKTNIEPYSSRNFKYDLLFVGANYSPNVEGINFFLTFIFPQILAQKPETKLAIAGTVAKSIQIDASCKQNVDCLGYVPNLSELYLKSKLVICPLLNGSGTKVKLQEAMAYALPIVSTNLGASGLDLKDGVNCFITDNADIYAQRIIRILEEPELAKTISQEINKTFEKLYSNLAVYSKLDQIFGIVPT